MSRETASDYVVGTGYMTFCSNEDKWKRKMRKDAEQFPDEVIITHEPVDSEDCMIIHCPANWFVGYRRPNKKNFTEEQKKQMSERAKAMNANKHL